ncbi:cytochrome c oxidase subunit II [Saccharobesus litoralis]|uniref:Cytochrome c oxidase subunit 2 n=2 Tax=Saccharobesus litoralis TaxID=2172099 RepID=A0A2S0VR45_9ALTE|nr:cytochrome c oxidase subunit II [Saccharobesus litoralis]AWB66686.1 cytochrome c oxidase subunit II [Saccharobesus litoralis]
MPLNMTRGVTSISADVYDLHMRIFYICTAIGVVVFGLMFWAMIFHRKSRGHKAANFHESVKVEIAWTVVPFIILIVMAIPATQTLIAMEDTSEPDVSILVTGSQWKWHYKYMENDIDFYSVLATPTEQITGKWDKGENYLLEVDRPLVIPTGKKVRFLMTSDDVIHSWWVPDFAVKKDANPGFINEAWTKVDVPGIYRGKCAELCGKDHGFMPVVVIAKSPSDYQAWVDMQVEQRRKAKEEEQRLLAMNMSMDELMAEGKKVYLANCAACHQPNGAGLPGVFPGLVGTGVVTGDINTHINVVVNGVGGTAMQAFGKQLTKKQIAAVVTYERNAWGNDTGDLVQVKDVFEFMKNSL